MAANSVQLVSAAGQPVIFDGLIVVEEPAGAIVDVANTTPTLTAYGFTLAQAEAIIANLNAITAALTALGVLA